MGHPYHTGLEYTLILDGLVPIKQEKWQRLLKKTLKCKVKFKQKYHILVGCE